jgi:uncharacterized protein YbjT (DUF2867 family)
MLSHAKVELGRSIVEDIMGTPFEDGTEGETRRGKLMADITNQNKVEHLVYSSVAKADKNTGIPHFESKYKIDIPHG